jgi:hypothetical protein
MIREYRRKHHVTPGQRFGQLTVVRAIENGNPRRPIECLCDCGQSHTIWIQSLVNGETRSCGCYKRAQAGTHSLRHGEARHGQQTPEYIAWCAMIRRCENPKATQYEHYGGRGITVCPAWRQSFEAFLGDMGRRPSIGHSVDRIDNNGNYEPGNCRWATKHTQLVNRRAAHLITIGDETKCLSDWARDRGMCLGTIEARIYRFGWDPVRAVLTPPNPRSQTKARRLRPATG